MSWVGGDGRGAAVEELRKAETNSLELSVEDCIVMAVQELIGAEAIVPELECIGSKGIDANVVEVTVSDESGSIGSHCRVKDGRRALRNGSRG